MGGRRKGRDSRPSIKPDAVSRFVPRSAQEVL